MHEPFTQTHHGEKITFSQLPNVRDELSHVGKHFAPQSSFTELRHPELPEGDSELLGHMNPLDNRPTRDICLSGFFFSFCLK